ncbi:hypothetical protein BCD67_22725 [Oscillatoriales cyanobacterium USR001]|nr:hypothetical protein BCD67_22725 [Oscillatoriales cyanobacterium USR001]
MKTISTIVVLFVLLILKLESSSTSLTAFNHGNGQKSQTEKIIANTNAARECTREDGSKYPCSP